MKINKLAVAVQWKCASCGLPIYHTVQRDYPSTEVTHEQIIEEAKSNLLGALEVHFRASGHDRTQHAKTCPEHTLLRIKTN